MPLDALDQKTLTGLPRVSEVYEAYGVQVNDLSVDEIFALYERTGFLYPDKAARPINLTANSGEETPRAHMHPAPAIRCAAFSACQPKPSVSSSAMSAAASA